MENINNEFMRKAENDFNISGDRLDTEVASVTTREIQHIETINNELFMNVDIPEAYRIDAKPFIERPFYAGEVVFADTAERYSLLTNPIQYLPGDIVRSNLSLTNLFKMGAYGMPDLYLNISMAGTIKHSGCVLAGILPPLPKYPTVPVKQLINTILSGPHAFLYANEATSVAMPVTWFCNTDMQTLDMQTDGGNVPTLDITATNGNYATLVFLVLNPLKPAEGATKQVDIIIEACFKHFDIVIPTPRFVTWTPQAKKLSSLNPNFEYERPIDTRPATRIKKTLVPFTIVSGIVTIVAIAARVIVNVVTGVDVPIDNVVWSPQSKVVNSAKSFGTGLFDYMSKGAKQVVGDAVDGVRDWLRSWTGLHNPNFPTINQRMITNDVNFSNVVDAQQFFEKLDPNASHTRIVKEPIFGTSHDEMDITHITSKDQYLGTITVNDQMKVGQLLWVRPISPFQGGYGLYDGDLLAANNLELMHSLHRGWRGGLKLKIQSVMNNTQQVKLKVLKMYNPSLQARSAYPAYQSIANAPSHLLEFTQGGQTHEISLPFLSRNEIQPRAENMELEGLMHGLYYVYVAQALVVSDGSPTSVEFNVYMAGEPDLAFFGYTTANTYHANFNLYSPPITDTLTTDNVGTLGTPRLIKLAKNRQYHPSLHVTNEHIHPRVKDMKEEEQVKYFNENYKKILYASAKTGLTPYQLCSAKYIVNKDGIVDQLKVGPHVTWNGQAKVLEVMNQPQKQGYNYNASSSPDVIKCNTRLLPNVDIRPLIRRLYKTTTFKSTLEGGAVNNVYVPLSSFLGENPVSYNYTPIEIISRMYYGKTVGFKFRLVLTVLDDPKPENYINARAYYAPQNVNLDVTTNSILGSFVNLASFTSPTESSTIGEIPLTYVMHPNSNNSGQLIIEFVIPDTSYYKFMGSPQKFLDFGVNSSFLSTFDFGSLVIQLDNPSNAPIDYTYELFVGLTDESRFGFHSIAPPFTISKNHAYYLGSSTDPQATVPVALNPYLYKGGYL